MSGTPLARSTRCSQNRQKRTNEVRMSVWMEPADYDNMETIRETFRLPSNSAAIRYALQRLAMDIRER